jgi:post-segregation antitoxin (ccd killing protein)
LAGPDQFQRLALPPDFPVVSDGHLRKPGVWLALRGGGLALYTASDGVRIMTRHPDIFDVAAAAGRRVSVGSVYTMRMARVNVYLPDDLARQARAAGMSVSNVTQVALRRELGARNTSEWLSRLARLPALKVAHEQVLSAIDAEREEFGHHVG